jgi:hypothetical protein
MPAASRPPARGGRATRSAKGPFCRRNYPPGTPIRPTSGRVSHLPKHALSVAARQVKACLRTMYDRCQLGAGQDTGDSGDHDGGEYPAQCWKCGCCVASRAAGRLKVKYTLPATIRVTSHANARSGR